MFYLFAITDHHNRTGFVLNTDDNHNLHDCKRLINWQMQGGFDRNDYRICKRVSANEFKCINTNNIYTFKERSPYTEKHYNEFISNWTN